MKELEEAAIQLAYWLERHNLGSAGVELKVVLKDSYTAHAARACGRMEMPPSMVTDQSVKDGKLRIMGLTIDFTSPDRTR